MFSNRTTLFFLIGSLLQATAFIPINFILPQLFQGVTGADSLTSGLMLLPFAFSVSICSTIGKSESNTVISASLIHQVAISIPVTRSSDQSHGSDMPSVVSAMPSSTVSSLILFLWLDKKVCKLSLGWELVSRLSFPLSFFNQLCH